MSGEMPIAVREFRRADLAGIKIVFRQVAAHHEACDELFRKTPDAADVWGAYIDTLRQDEEAHILVAERGDRPSGRSSGRVVGYCVPKRCSSRARYSRPRSRTLTEAVYWLTLAGFGVSCPIRISALCPLGWIEMSWRSVKPKRWATFFLWS